MARKSSVKLDLVGCVWDADGRQQPLGGTFVVQARPWTAEQQVSGHVLVGLAHERVDVVGRIRMQARSGSNLVSLAVEGSDSEGHLVRLVLESPPLRSLRSLPDLSSLEGTLERVGEPWRRARLRHDTRVGVAMLSIWGSDSMV